MIGLENKTLTSQRLEYRLLVQADKESLAGLLRSPSVTKPAGFLPADSEEAFDQFFSELTRYHTAVAILHHDQLIGYFHVNKYNLNQEAYAHKSCVGVGFVIGKDYQKQGFGTEMLRRMTQYLLSVFDVCVADCFKENVPSRKTIERCGYAYLEDYTMFFDALGQEKTCSSYVRQR